MTTILDLPRLSDSVTQALISLGHQHVLSHGWKDNSSAALTNPSQVIARRNFIMKDSSFDKGVRSYLRELLSDYLDSLYFRLIMIESPTGELSCFPPHNDDRRPVGINYILEEGGDNVVTRLYSHPESMTVELENGKFFDESKLTCVEEMRHKEGTWVLFDPQTIHSVNNISGFRTVLVVNPLATVTIEELQQTIPTKELLK